MVKMQNFLKMVGLLVLFVMSFYYTEKTITVVRDMDEIMVELKQKSKAYTKESMDAKIKDDTIIPGISGKSVNLNKSYIKMKEYGKFNENLLVYQKMEPAHLLKENYDKFVIGGNKEKRMVSLIFLVDEQDEIDSIRSIVKRKKVGVTFFLDGEFVEANLEELEEIKKEGHTLGNYGYHQDYDDSSFIWIDTMFSRLAGQKQNYCFSKRKNTKILNVCHLYQNYTIVPTFTVSETPLITIKKQVRPGAFIALPVSKEVIKELPSIISYLEQKGYQVVNLEHHLEE